MVRVVSRDMSLIGPLFPPRIGFTSYNLQFKRLVEAFNPNRFTINKVIHDHHHHMTNAEILG